MSRITTILLTFLLVLTSTAFAQSEAESIHEALVFQQKNTNQTIEVKVGDRIQVLEKVAESSPLTGEVVSLEENGLEIFVKNSGKKYAIDLRQIDAISTYHNKGGVSTGAIALIATGSVMTGVFFILTLATIPFIMYGGAAIFVFMLLCFLGGLGMLWAGIRRKKKRTPQILLKLWEWRLVFKKKVLVKKKVNTTR